MKRVLATAVVGAIALAGCSSTAAQSSTTTSSTAAASSSTTPPTAKILPVTSVVTAQLVQAGAALNQLPASVFTGLEKGRTFYAYDPVAKTYWAGAALDPSRSSLRAQVSVQDDGGYVLFTRPAGGVWKAEDVGLADPMALVLANAAFQTAEFVGRDRRHQVPDGCPGVDPCLVALGSRIVSPFGLTGSSRGACGQARSENLGAAPLRSANDDAHRALGLRVAAVGRGRRHGRLAGCWPTVRSRRSHSPHRLASRARLVGQHRRRAARSS